MGRVKTVNFSIYEPIKSWTPPVQIAEGNIFGSVASANSERQID